MDWVEFCENDTSMLHYFSKPPSLEVFTLIEVNWMGHSPSVLIGGDIPIAPERGLNFNRRRCDGFFVLFGFGGITEFKMEGCASQPTGKLQIFSPPEGGVGVRFDSELVRCEAQAEAMSIVSAFPRYPDFKPPRVPRLASFRNVWNSCLLLAESKGFSLSLIGDPDREGMPTWCRWKATKEDGAELIGDTPVELIGLIALYEHRKSESPGEYWWHIHGPDLVGGLEKEWTAKFHGPGVPPKSSF